MLKLRLSIALCIICFVGFAQQKDTTKLVVLSGINMMPFSLNKGLLAITNFSLQLGNQNGPLKAVIKFGLPNYSLEITSNHSTSYNIKGNYVMPGMIFYVGDICKEKDVFFIGLMGYFSKYTHSLNINVIDTIWNTSQPYNFKENELINGFVFEMGGLFTLYKKLKLTGTIHTGWVSYSKNPIPQIAGFNRVDSFLPGVGTNYDFLIGLSVGFHYLIY
jgi:hypothetical protein